MNGCTTDRDTFEGTYLYLSHQCDSLYMHGAWSSQANRDGGVGDFRFVEGIFVGWSMIATR